MFGNVSGLFALVQRLVHKLSLLLLAIFALTLIGFSMAAGLRLVPWPELSLAFNGKAIENAGMYAQLGLTALIASLLFFLPANARMMRLEHSHRDFHIRMHDVALAYREAHEADRKQLFRIGSEFDSVRERMMHLRDHPDLRTLEPEILELAAQMSHESRDLAETYSDEKVDRARLFLRQRQQEADQLDERLTVARTSIEELRHWLLQVETDESMAAKQIEILEKDLMELLPKLGGNFSNDEEPSPLQGTKENQGKKVQTVVSMSKRTKSKANEKAKVH
ncbi:MAG TPA: DNA repair protein [Armatimonadetes bacterium]|nr:DNA repair protein [Armatimonadota bacterium]